MKFTLKGFGDFKDTKLSNPSLLFSGDDSCEIEWVFDSKQEYVRYIINLTLSLFLINSGMMKISLERRRFMVAVILMTNCTMLIYH